MKMFSLCIAAIFASSTACSFALCETADVYETLCETSAILDSSGEETTVTVTGKRFERGSQYFTDIMIRLSDGRCIFPPSDEGYGAGVAAFDFGGKGVCQLFYFASSGGSGGYGYFYVFDCSCEKIKTVFDYKKFANPYRAEYVGSSLLKIYEGGEPFVTFDLKDKRGEESCIEDRRSESSGFPYVTNLNYVDPVFVYSLNRYRLNVWQNVIGEVETDVVGRIVTTMTYDESTGEFVRGYSCPTR